MKKIFLTLAVFVMAICVNAQKNQYFWYQGNLLMGNPIAQIDSVTFGEGEPTDTLHIMLPRTIIKTVHDTVYITIHDTVCPNNIPEGALVGEFSVGSTKKVRFSKGNLQYQASTDTWRFAENQWDYVGSANANISSSYSGWIDMFGWGTGDNPTRTSSNNSYYSTFTDWGSSYTTNNECSQTKPWRTMTSDEWTYLFRERLGAESLFGFGCVNGVNGLIILPDNWVSPDNVTFTPSTSLGLIWNIDLYKNSNGNNFTHNIFTLEQWEILEISGAVFFPAAGYRYGTNYAGALHDGYYWSSTPDSNNNAYYMGFSTYDLRTYNYGNRTKYGRYVGQSVRLVQDVE